MKVRFSVLLTISAILSAVCLQACAGHPTYERGVRVKWADDAGSVSISPSAVTEWEEVANELQPNFKIDSATAYNNAIPTTGSLDERLSDLLTANLQVGLPTTNSTRITREVTDPDTGELVTTVDNSRTRQSGSTPDATTLTPGSAAALAALSGGSLSDDPMLRYLAATALQQEVALLNRYVRDRVRWPGAQAFVVQLQLSVIPNARSMPYDVETDITLHADDEQADARLAFALQQPNNPDGTSPPGRQCAADSQDTLQVLPMIVTDNLEGLRAARATDNVRQLALALIGTAGNVGAGGQFGRTIEALRRTEGRDTNSLFTIARLSDDTVRIHLGAVQSPRFGYVAVPRNHRISLVVIYRPCIRENRTGYDDAGTRVVTAVTRTSFRDAQSGRLLEYQDSTQRLYGLISGLQRRFVGQFSYLELARMYQWATRQDNPPFFAYVVGQHLDASMCDPGFFERLLVGDRPYRVSAPNYRDVTEPQDYLWPEGGTSEQPSSLPPGTQGAAANRPRFDPATRRNPPDMRCLTLARMRYELVAAPLWTELQSIRPTGQFAFTNIPLTLRTVTPVLPPRQAALINFSPGETSVTLAQGQDLANFRDIRLVLIGADEGPIPATTTTIAPSGRAIQATFPPLGRYGIEAPRPGTQGSVTVQPAQAAPPKRYTLELQVPMRTRMPAPCNGSAVLAPVPVEGAQAPSSTLWRSNELRIDSEGCTLTYPVRLHNAAAPTPASPFSVEAAASGIIASPTGGTGRLIVTVMRRQGAPETPAENMFLNIEGAQLVSVQVRGGAAIARGPRGWPITGPGDYVLELENLIPNTLVKVNLRHGDNDPVSVSRSVVGGAAASRPSS